MSATEITPQSLSTSLWTAGALLFAADSGILQRASDGALLTAENLRLDKAPPSLAAPLLNVCCFLGLLQREGEHFRGTSALLASVADGSLKLAVDRCRSALLQVADLERRSAGDFSGQPWHPSDERVIHAQGKLGSDEMVSMFERQLIPQMSNLGDRLVSSPSRILDVGVGAGYLSCAMARKWPEAHVTGIDPLEKAVRLAEENVVLQGLGAQIDVQIARVEDFSSTALFDLAWFPAPFIPRIALQCGIDNLAKNLVAGGWVISLALRAQATETIRDASLQFRNTLWGGNLVTSFELSEMFMHARFEVITSQATPHSEHVYVLARNRARH